MRWLQASFLTALIAAFAFAQALTAGEIRLDEIGAARAAVQSAELAYGPEDPATGMMVGNLALAFVESGYWNQAESYATRALSILEARFGDGDITLVPALNVLTEAYAGLGRYTAALRTCRRAVAIGPAAGPHYATALHNLASVLELQGNQSEARLYYQRALLARQEFLPEGHPYIQATRTALARVERAGKLHGRNGDTRSDLR